MSAKNSSFRKYILYIRFENAFIRYNTSAITRISSSGFGFPTRRFWKVL